MWKDSGHQTCPLTQKERVNDTLIPNHFAQRITSKWCEKHDTILSTVNKNHSPKNLPMLEDEKNVLNSLMDNLSSPSSHQVELPVKSLRFLLKHKNSIRAFVGRKPNLIPNLLSVLFVPALMDDYEVLENIVTAIFNLLIHQNNRKIIGNDPQTIPLLVNILKTIPLRTRCNAAAALSRLSCYDPNRVKIGESGAVGPLAWNLKHWNMELKKDMLGALSELCRYEEYSERLVDEGEVSTLMEMMKGEVLACSALALLTSLAQYKKGAKEIVELDGVGFLTRILREILYSILVDHKMDSREVKEEEGLHKTIVQVSEVGSKKAKTMARRILECLKRMFGM